MEEGGKTSQFWMVYYLDIMRVQYLISSNKQFLITSDGLKKILPFMFVLNMLATDQFM